LRKVFGSPRTTTSDNGNLHSVTNRPRQFHIIAFQRAVAIHGGQQNLASAITFGFLRPFHGIQTCVGASSRYIDIPTRPARGQVITKSPPRINCHDNTLATKALRSIADQLWIAYRRTIDTHLISARQKQSAHVLDRPNPTTDRKGNKDGVSYAPHHIDHRIACFMGCRNIQEDQFIRAFLVIDFGLLNRVASINKVNEVYPLDNPAIFDI
jgi:hypothetical protein